MKTKISLMALMAAASIGVAAAAGNAPWRVTVDRCVAQGEFKKAEKIMNSLPRAQRKAAAVQIDSIKQIMQRIRMDFTLDPADGVKQIRERMPQVTDEQIEAWKSQRKLEVMNIDGKECWFRKSVRNLWLMADELAEQHQQDKEESFEQYRGYYARAMSHPSDNPGVRDWHHARVTFTLDVDADAVPAGETLRVWMPFPYANMRQRNIQLESANRDVTYSEGSKHHTVYMEAKAEKGKPTHFEYTFSYDVGERHIAKQDILAMVKPYDTSKDDYKRYTGNEGRHVVITDSLRSLAHSIVGNETNPVLQANMIYCWISRQFPWAGAREYSTIANIPEYVLLNRHGDCGQVALLYITLTRALGIPSRWESGYMLHPGAINFHDWAETYYEGVGWVPVDPSFGRDVVDTSMEDYYASGLDVYRMASNEAVGQPLSPAKKYIRSETVDFQSGEVEWRGGNLYYDKWHSHFNLDSMEPLGVVK